MKEVKPVGRKGQGVRYNTTRKIRRAKLVRTLKTSHVEEVQVNHQASIVFVSTSSQYSPAHDLAYCLRHRINEANHYSPPRQITPDDRTEKIPPEKLKAAYNMSLLRKVNSLRHPIGMRMFRMYKARPQYLSEAQIKLCEELLEEADDQSESAE